MSEASPPEADRMLVPDFWPRLYLDTGDLLEVADGRVDPGLVHDLLTAVEEHVVWLVISSSHLQDALTAEDPSTIDRLATALERFRFRCLITKDVECVEPWPESGAAADIEIQGCLNIREILTCHATSPQLASMRELQHAMHRALLFARALRHATGSVAIPKHHTSVALDSTITQVLGWMGDDPAPIVLHHVERHGGTPTTQEVVNLILAQEPIATAMREATPFIDAHSIDRAELMKQMAFSMASDGFKRAPGMWLAGALHAGFCRDIARVPKLSDSVDALHARCFPYVDIASCDAQSHKILSSLISRARGPRLRPVALFRNGRLPDVLAYIRTLPNGRELARQQCEE